MQAMDDCNGGACGEAVLTTQEMRMRAHGCSHGCKVLFVWEVEEQHREAACQGREDEGARDGAAVQTKHEGEPPVFTSTGAALVMRDVSENLKTKLTEILVKHGEPPRAML